MAWTCDITINSSKLKSASGLSGFLAIIVFCLTSSISVSFIWGWFSPFDVWIGDFGSPTANPSGAIFYNAGCMLTGILLCIFYLGLAKWLAGRRIRDFIIGAGVLFGVVSGAMLFLTGYLSTGLQPLHFQISVLFFVFSLAAITSFTLGLVGLSQYGEATACIGITTIALTLLMALSYALEVEPIIVQWFTGLSMLSWIALFSYDSLALRKNHE